MHSSAISASRKDSERKRAFYLIWMTMHPWPVTMRNCAAWSGLLARLTAAGLSDHTIEPFNQLRGNLACLGAAVGVFVVFATAMWAQLSVGWQWSKPGAGATLVAMVIMSAAMLVLFFLTLLAAVPIGSCVLRGICRNQRGLLRPSLLLVTSTSFLVLGSRHFANGWPGTGGNLWALRGLVPATWRPSPGRRLERGTHTSGIGQLGPVPPRRRSACCGTSEERGRGLFPGLPLGAVLH